MFQESATRTTFSITVEYIQHLFKIYFNMNVTDRSNRNSLINDTYTYKYNIEMTTCRVRWGIKYLLWSPLLFDSEQFDFELFCLLEIVSHICRTKHTSIDDETVVKHKHMYKMNSKIVKKENRIIFIELLP